MTKKFNIKRFLGIALILLITSMLLLPELAEARRGGSFGGSRGFKGFGGKRTTSKTVKPGRTNSFGGATRSKTSFGGSRMSKQQATAKYGTPRRVQKTVGKDGQGKAQNYNVNHYGGYSSSLMTGYMMGHTSMLWMMPFHPAFYYSRPQYVENKDGSIDVYPPTISITKIIMGILLFALVVWLIRSMFRKPRGDSEENRNLSSFN